KSAGAGPNRWVDTPTPWAPGACVPESPAQLTFGLGAALSNRMPSLRSRVPFPLRGERLNQERLLQHRTYPTKDAVPDQDSAEGAAQCRSDTRRQPGPRCRHGQHRDPQEEARGSEASLASEVEVVEKDEPEMADGLRTGADEEDTVGQDRVRWQPQPMSARIRGQLQED